VDLDHKASHPLQLVNMSLAIVSVDDCRRRGERFAAGEGSLISWLMSSLSFCGRWRVLLLVDVWLANGVAR
jgi:hypothetical protein